MGPQRHITPCQYQREINQQTTTTRNKMIKIVLCTALAMIPMLNAGGVTVADQKLEDFHLQLPDFVDLKDLTIMKAYNLVANNIEIAANAEAQADHPELFTAPPTIFT